MNLIVGLGNPGAKYQFTRHNIGFMTLEALAARWEIELSQKGFHSVYGKGGFAGRRVLLAQPRTYMNRSGLAVQEITSYFQIPTANIIVIHDDLDFPFGTIRLKLGGGHGGHRGMLSLLAELGTADFARLRIGIDKPAQRDFVESYVLEAFPAQQRRDLPKLIESAARMVESFIEKGAAATMNRFHHDDTSEI